VADKKITEITNGPVYWVDSADSQPCVGTAGSIRWHLKVTGRLFHSGLAHKGINALELGMEAIKEIQGRFYKAFPPHPDEKK
jgi:acetylornithine deacetylase